MYCRNRINIRPSQRWIGLAAVSAILLTACGGGSSGGSQDPDPVVVDLPIAYVKRPLRDIIDIDNDGDVDEIFPDNVTDPGAFNAGAVLYIRDRASGSASETNISDRAYNLDPLFTAGEPYDVKDLSVSSNGEKLIFAMRAPEDPNLQPDEQAKWDIWEYDITKDVLRRIISDQTTAQEANDISPHYLPDGRIVFSSDRQQQSKAILLDDGKPRYAALHESGNQPGEYGYVLHVMDDDGANIQQITYNQSHDLQPTVLDNGRILFLRWDQYANNNWSLYTVKPDGTDLQSYYGFHSQNTGTNNSQAVFSQPREMPDGRILAILKPRNDNRFGGDMVLIDGANYIDISQGTDANSGAAGPGQSSASPLAILVGNDTNQVPLISVPGRFNSAYPFFDGTDRMLVSWNQCRLVDPQDPNPTNPTTFLPCTAANLADPAVLEAPPLYGVWIYNPADGTQLPVITPEEDFIYRDVVAMEPRTPPAFIPPPTPGVDVDQALIDEAVGVVHIRSVYDFDGVDTTANGINVTRDPGQPDYATRPARFLRIVKAVSQPDDDVFDFDNNAFGVAGAQRMKEILGYVPIEPDGSAMFKVPANVAFSISVLNGNLARVSQRHQNWLQVRAGEVLQCNGCHTRNSQLPHGRRDAEATSVNTGAPTTGIPFPNTDQAKFAEMGETMAETYARFNGPRTPDFNIVYTDEWTDRTNAGLTPDPDINLLYTDPMGMIGLNTTPPVSVGCQNNWNSTCRAIINYEQHIQPIWDLPGRLDGMGGNAVCTDCHNTVDPNNANAPMVPAAQIDLTGNGPAQGALNNNNNTLRTRSYQELFFQDVALELNAGGTALQRQQVSQPDGMGGTILVDVNAPPPPMPSGAFFSIFSAGGTHATRLTPAELKLISEWVDIGAQYYNNPFDAPLN